MIRYETVLCAWILLQLTACSQLAKKPSSSDQPKGPGMIELRLVPSAKEVEVGSEVDITVEFANKGFYPFTFYFYDNPVVEHVNIRYVYPNGRSIEINRFLSSDLGPLSPGEWLSFTLRHGETFLARKFAQSLSCDQVGIYRVEAELNYLGVVQAKAPPIEIKVRPKQE